MIQTFAAFLVATGCSQKSSGEEEGPISIASGDIVISNINSRDVKVFSSTGVYKGTILDLDNTTGQAPYGLTYNDLTGEILIAVDSTTSRLIKAYKVSTGVVRDFSASAALSGTLRSLAMLSTGELLVVIGSGNRVEKLDGVTGVQITAGAWPKALQTTGTGIAARASGTFVHCSTGSDVTRLYDASGTQTATVASGIAGTTDVMDCKADSSGNIYSIFNGTTDTVRKKTSGLVTTWSYSNTTLMPNPTALAVRSDGTVLVADGTLNYVLELSASGATATVLGGDTDNMLNNPSAMLIIP